MTTITASEVTVRPPRRADQIAIAVFGTWTVIGLFLDGWAHNHQKPETFFTPWHAVLYSGVAAGVAWGWWDARRTGIPLLAGDDRLTRLGLMLFGAAAAGDFVWHQVFGIEVSVEALLSPTHLTLMTGGLLMLSAPLRAQWNSERTDATPEVLVSAALTTAVAAFFVQFASVLRTSTPSLPSSAHVPLAIERAQIYGILTVLFTNLVVLIPIALLLRRFRVPFAGLALVSTIVAVLVSALDGFQAGPLILAFVLGGLTADIAAPRLSLARTLALTSLVTWLSYFAIYAARFHLGWSVELWAGVTYLAVLSAAGIGLLADRYAPAV
jgi:hypothetical protein